MSQILYEEEEASRRDPNKDLELHQSVCAELCRTMDRLKELKADRAVSWKSEKPQLYFDVSFGASVGAVLVFYSALAYPKCCNSYD